MADASHTEEPSKRKSTWMRGFYMLIFILLMELAGTVLAVIALIQFIWMLLNGDKNGDLSRFGRGFGRWFREAVAFQTCETDEKPFPWKAWPADKAEK